MSKFTKVKRITNMYTMETETILLNTDKIRYVEPKFFKTGMGSQIIFEKGMSMTVLNTPDEVVHGLKKCSKEK